MEEAYPCAAVFSLYRNVDVASPLLPERPILIRVKVASR
jgi:hypothetical protein